ncbi:hypothetical protein [Kribbella sp. NPDC055071]
MMVHTEVAAERLAPELGLRRVGLLISTVVGPAGLVVSNLLFALMTLHGGTDETGADSLALATAHPGEARFATFAAIVGSLFMVPAAIAAMRVIGSRSARLGFISGTLVAAGYICYFGVGVFNTVVLAMAEHGGPMGDFASVLDASQGGDPAFGWIFFVFILGNIVGTLMLGIALLRSKAVPTFAAAFITAWPPLHIVGLFVLGNEWPEVLGGVLQLIGFVAVGNRVLRK